MLPREWLGRSLRPAREIQRLKRTKFLQFNRAANKGNSSAAVLVRSMTANLLATRHSYGVDFIHAPPPQALPFFSFRQAGTLLKAQ